MNKRLVIFIALLLLAFASCIPSKQGATQVPFKVANNYFVSNAVGDGPLANPIIESQNQFNSLFGMATTMGENGKPTPINFDQQFVIALVGKVTDKPETYTVTCLANDKEGLILTYKLAIADKQTYTSQASCLLIVERTFINKIKLIQEN